MRIDLRSKDRQPLYTVTVDTQSPPTVVKPPQGDGPELYLDWDQSLDDTGHLRRCPACGCRDLFAAKEFSQVTGLALVVAAAILAMAIYGWGGPRYLGPAIGVLVVVLLVDALIYFFAKRYLVCYRCRSEYHAMKMRSDHASWNPTVGERYPAKANPSHPPTDRSKAQ